MPESSPTPPKITLAQFWMGRDVKFATELTDEIRAFAADTVERANHLLALYAPATGDFRPRGVTSGWRPAAVNVNAGGAKRSNHMLGRACDVADASGKLDEWLVTAAGLASLGECGLWLEDPSATPGWCHVQTVAPRSGRRVFMP